MCVCEIEILCRESVGGGFLKIRVLVGRSFEFWISDYDVEVWGEFGKE